ncbi:MAG: hypothetical protein AYL32_009080 [Candidatus Bathyarchaeota archaeon B26-2]|nr:MAG: hypothetical protein AYL32_009080 [Candidatus Bathyarchaeota archaeon B26-2]
MKQLEIPVRYYYVDSDQEVWRIESKFHYLEKTLSIDPKEAALILLDIWKEGESSFSKRAAEITLKRIVPVVEAARDAGVTVVHAPSPRVAKRYPQWTRFAGDEEIEPPKRPPPDWPPPEFVRREGKYSQYSRKIYRGPKYLQSLLGGPPEIADPVKPLPEDYVVTTGSHLHRLLKAEKILHLFYAGFYVNMCIQYRDYGMRAMGARGYNVILLRDCTTAIENHDTVDELLITKMSIRHIETLLGFSTTSEDFIKACRALRA